MYSENESGNNEEQEYLYWRAWTACGLISQAIKEMSFDEFVTFIDSADMKAKVGWYVLSN